MAKVEESLKLMGSGKPAGLCSTARHWPLNGVLQREDRIAARPYSEGFQACQEFRTTCLTLFEEIIPDSAVFVVMVHQTIL